MATERAQNGQLNGQANANGAQQDPSQSGAAPSNGKQQDTASQKSESSQKKPPGGYDKTPVPHAPPGYTVKITFHRATHLPIADFGNLSSDPYLHAELHTSLQPRHKVDPGLKFRSRTIWKTTEPEWDEAWILEHVPASGFKMKVRIYDEDGSDKDDRLGNVHITVGRIDENWKGIKNQAYKIEKRSGSWRAYAIRAVAVSMRETKKMNGDLYVSVEVMGKSEGSEGGRCYTKGLNYWFKHKSALLGRITNLKEPDSDDSDSEEHDTTEDAGIYAKGDQSETPQNNLPGQKFARSRSEEGEKKKAGKYDFQANQIQLSGPVPPELYHRYVEFRPIIGSLFTAKGLRGIILHRALHYQHDRIYNFNRDTTYGVFQRPSEDMTRQFLDMVHHDKGGRIFTYCITLDAMIRFTETGKEFGIDLLSKHTMHSDASIYIAFSGEFFVRRLAHPEHDGPEEAEAKASHGPNSGGPDDQSAKKSKGQAEKETGNETHPPKSVPNGPPSGPPPADPHYYELIIDNDSGTYRPNADMLPVLRKFLHSNFPGLKIVTLDCNKDKELMDRWKGEQREMKKKEGKNRIYTQVSGSESSLSSEDVERIQRRDGGGEGSDGGEGGAKHRLGEAAGPFLGNHSKLRKALGAGGS